MSRKVPAVCRTQRSSSPHQGETYFQYVRKLAKHHQCDPSTLPEDDCVSTIPAIRGQQIPVRTAFVCSACFVVSQNLWIVRTEDREGNEDGSDARERRARMASIKSEIRMSKSETSSNEQWMQGKERIWNPDTLRSMRSPRWRRLSEWRPLAANRIGIASTDRTQFYFSQPILISP